MGWGGGLHSPVLVCAFCNFRNCCKKLPSLANLLETLELCAFAILDPRQRTDRVSLEKRGGSTPCRPQSHPHPCVLT